MTRPLLGALALSGLVPVLGCGPIEYVRMTSGRTAAAIDQARRARAAELAPYEFTMASAFANKSRELAGHARFDVAIDYGRRAEELAAKAEALARVRQQRQRAAEVSR